MGEEALTIGADTFQFFTRNPRGGSVRKLDIDDMKQLNELMAAHDFAPILAHAPYTLNGCSKTERTRQFAVEAMSEDLQRLEYLDNCRYNFIPAATSGRRGRGNPPHCVHDEPMHVFRTKDDGAAGNHGRQGDGSRPQL